MLAVLAATSSPKQTSCFPRDTADFRILPGARQAPRIPACSPFSQVLLQ